MVRQSRIDSLTPANSVIPETVRRVPTPNCYRSFATAGAVIAFSSMSPSGGSVS